jgi:hypothetical protein
VRKSFVIPAEAGIQPFYKFCKNGKYMSILQCFICVIPNGIHQSWIPASAGMTEGFAVFAQPLHPVGSAKSIWPSKAAA